MRWRLVDRITRYEPWKSISGVKAVSFEEYCLLEPLGIRGRLPESLIIGCFAELAAWLMAASTGFDSACLLKEIKTFSLDGACMGSVLVLDLEAVRRDGETLEVACRLSYDGKQVGGGGLVFDIVLHRELYNSEARMVLWRELYGEA